MNKRGNFLGWFCNVRFWQAVAVLVVAGLILHLIVNKNILEALF